MRIRDVLLGALLGLAAIWFVAIMVYDLVYNGGKVFRGFFGVD